MRQVSAQNLDINPEFARALAAMEQGKNLLITGKAGTGKSTLLTYFRSRQVVPPPVVAPTGIAALNVKGQTIHRFFGWKPSINPDMIESGQWDPPEAIGSQLKRLKCLIVDEISMVRADLFDCMDLALRRFGPERGASFGGVHLILFGDLLQLDPVMEKSEERWWFKHYGYRTKFFFSAHAMQELNLEAIELKKIYRQRDADFIELLECVRSDRLTQEGLNRINDRFDPEFNPETNSPYIIVTPRNDQVDRINKRKLSEIPAPEYQFQAQVLGKIETQDWGIIEQDLRLKVGAKVMMINNQQDELWVNGSIGVVQEIDTDEEVISVMLLDSNREVKVGRHTFEIGRHERTASGVEWVVIGAIIQFPMRLSWAITVHKSQGQTLSHLVIDPYQGFFADGHLYVALSRCTTFEGIKLHKKVRHSDLKVSREVLRFLRDGSEQQPSIERRRVAFLGLLETGYNEYSKVVELAAIVVTEEGSLESFSTLIAPMTDIGEAASHRIKAEDLCLAPRLTEAWGFIARRLHNAVLVCFDSAKHFRLLSSHLKAEQIFHEMPVGCCLTEETGGSLETALDRHGIFLSPTYSAMELAESTKSVFDVLMPDIRRVDTFDGKLSTLGAARLFSRDSVTLPNCLSSKGPFRNTATLVSKARNYGDYAALALSDLANCPRAGNLIWNCQQALDVPSQEIEQVHNYLCRSLQEAIERDARLDENEENYAKTYYAALEREMPRFEQGSSADFSLEAGMTVCFSGDGTFDEKSQRFVEKEEFEEAAEAWGLKVEGSVTKSRTDVLILMDITSMSSKAKMARKWKKPVWSIDQFSEAIGFRAESR